MIHTVVIGCSTFPGAEPTRGDLAIDGGLIAAVGKVDGRGQARCCATPDSDTAASREPVHRVAVFDRRGETRQRDSS